MNKFTILLALALGVFFFVDATAKEVKNDEDISSQDDDVEDDTDDDIEEDDDDDFDRDDDDDSFDAEERRRGGRRRHGRRRRPWQLVPIKKYLKCGNKCQCPAGQKLVKSFTATTANSAFTYKCVADQICYWDCTNVPCKQNCILATTTSKPGTCPTVDCPTQTVYSWWYKPPLTSSTCTTDNQCYKEQKCCQLAPSNIRKCVHPVPTGNKCGTCPTLPATCTIDAANNEAACTQDSNCVGGLKCCTCGAVKKCVIPIAPFTVV